MHYTFIDGGHYFTYKQYLLQQNITLNKLSCVIGDPICFASISFRNAIQNAINSDQHLSCFPELQCLSVADKNLASFQSQHSGIQFKDNLYEIVADCNRLKQSSAFLAVGYENAAISVAIAIIRARMAGIINFKVLGEFYHLPNIISLLPEAKTETHLVFPEGWKDFIDIESVNKTCQQKNYTPVYLPTTAKDLHNKILNPNITEEHTPTTPSTSEDSYAKMLHEVFEVDTDNPLVYKPKQEYQYAFISYPKPNISLPKSCQIITEPHKQLDDCISFQNGNCNPNKPLSESMSSGKGKCRIMHYLRSIQK